MITVFYIYLAIASPFILCKFIQTIMLFLYNKVLPLTLKGPNGRETIKNIVDDVDSHASDLPDWAITTLLLFISLVLSLVSAIMWWTVPSHSLRGVVETLLWEFEEV